MNGVNGDAVLPAQFCEDGNKSDLLMKADFKLPEFTY